MTDALLRRVRPRVAFGPLQRKDLEAARTLCARNPVAYVLPAMHVERALADTAPATGRLWALHERSANGRTLVGVVWHGVNLVPALPEPSEVLLAGLADAMVGRLNRPSALVGEVDVVLDLWRRVERPWGPARAIRDEQWLMALSEHPRHPAPTEFASLGLEPVSLALPEDFDTVLPAAVHMFIGEVGYDPTLHGRGVYEDRLRRLIRHGRSFVQFGWVDGERRVVFKAEVGVIGGGVAEIQGVWVEPTLRGRGLAKAGLAAVCDAIQAGTALAAAVPTVSLYVNSFNTAAIAAYEAIGFKRMGTFATVML